MSRNKPHQTAWWHQGIYPVHIGYCPTEAAWLETEIELGVKPEFRGFPESPGICCHYVNLSGWDAILINVKPHKDRTVFIGLLAHECVHAAKFLAKTIGETEPGREFDTYIVQNLIMHCIAADKRHRHRLKPHRGKTPP